MTDELQPLPDDDGVVDGVPVLDDDLALVVPPPTDGGDASLLALIDRLTEVLERSDLTELEVEAGGTGLLLRKPIALERAVSVSEPIPVGVPAPAATARRRWREVRRAPATLDQGAAHRHLLRRAIARCDGVRLGRRPRVGRPGHRAHRGDEAVQRDQERPRGPGGPDRRHNGALVKAKSPLIEVDPQ